MAPALSSRPTLSMACWRLSGLGLALLLAGCATAPDPTLDPAPLIVRTTDGSGQTTETRVTPPPSRPRPRRLSARSDTGASASESRAASTDAGSDEGHRVMLNFVDADLAGVVASLARFTQRNFLVDPRVKGTLTLVSEAPVSAQTAYDMLLTALRMQGFAVVEVDGVQRVVPEADAKLQGGAVSDGPQAAGSPTGSSSGVITRVFQLRYENAANLVPVLRPLIPANSTITAYPGNNTLVVSDYADNMARIAQVIDRIDIPATFSTDVVPIEYGVALDVAALANQLLQAQGPGGRGSGATMAVADPRSNSVILRAPNQAQLDWARDLIIRIDNPSVNNGNLHVVYLRNAQATQLAEVLRGVLTGQGSLFAGLGGASAAANYFSTPAGGAVRQNSNRLAADGDSSNTSLSDSSEGGGSLDGASLNAVSFSAGGASIQADPTTNTLIISAPEPLYRSLREVIDQLDQRRAQVLVESLIVEVTAGNAAEFGIQWSAGGTSLENGNASFIGGANFGGAGIGGSGTTVPLTTVDALGRGLSLGMVKGTIDILGNEVINLGVLARALQTQDGVNILSTPNLMTLDNEEASIMVGRTVPFTTGRYITSGDGAGTNPFQTIEREDVGLTLRIRPQISEGGTVKMALYQEVSSIDPAASSATNGLVTRKRALKTNVLVDNDQIIVLGGLIEDTVGTSTDSVPLLGDIPILGELFRYNRRERTKTNLMIFLRPHIIRNARDTASLTLDRYNYIRDMQRALPSTDHWLLHDVDQSVLPAASLRPQDGLIDLRGNQTVVPLPVHTEVVSDHDAPVGPTSAEP